MIEVGRIEYNGLLIVLTTCQDSTTSPTDHFHFDIQCKDGIEFEGKVYLYEGITVTEILNRIMSMYIDGTYKYMYREIENGSITIQ